MPLLLTCLATTLLTVTPVERPTIAVLPPVPIEGAESWLGMAVADNLSSELLRYVRPGQGPRDFPLNVFSWRETTSAARGEGLRVDKPLSPASLSRLAAQLGARWIFSGSYKVSRGRVLLKWRLTDTQSKKPAREVRVTTNLATLARSTEQLTAAVLKGLGEKKLPKAAAAATRPPTDAMEAYGRGLEILARQSLEPYAPIVVPALELKKARLLFEQATAATPTLWRAWVGLAMSSAMLGEHARAEKEVLTALSRTGELELQSALGLYYLYVRQGKPDEAIATLADATRKHPGFLGALGYLGSAYQRAGKLKEAVETFGAYKERVPKSPWARLAYARAVAYDGRPEQGLTETAAVAKDFPDSLTVQEALAARQTQMGEYADATATLERALASFGEQPALLARLAYIHLEQDEPEEALSIARRAVELLGDGRGTALAGYAYTNLGQALARTGKEKEALAAFEKAVTLGVGLEERLQLLEDERTKKLLQESALARDATPPAPSAKTPEPTLTREEAGHDAPEVEASEDAPAQWDEEGEWEEGEDWSEEALDDAP